MFEQAFKNIDDILRKEAGCTTELDYTEQTSWLLFLKYLDGLEQDKADEAALEGKKYTFILDFVLSQYIKVGVGELDQDKLSPLLKLKYNNAIADAVADLGRPEEIGQIFSGFQKYLYQQTPDPQPRV